uniref:phosphoserine transaminase n=1 Tax=Corethron hystrix TaxID=216773 RepID=A0A7S1BUY7_9STRA|mmetsp:Transcript_42110/g.98660  ORF Transcript_42110/g.98660 Transcript_42110/m.98660 type:complete len:400 (+) Transcript_42110:430-1629(+)
MTPGVHLSENIHHANRDNFKTLEIGREARRVRANFGAGPAGIPVEVLLEAQRDFLSHSGGLSVVEMSHRSPEYKEIHFQAMEDLRSIMNVPSTHEIIFQQGGASTQFSAVALNLCQTDDCVGDYVLSGEWSRKASEEAKKFCKVNIVNDQDAPLDTSLFVNSCPKPEEFTFSKNASFFYYCDNETIHGTEYHEVLTHPNPDVPIVIDAASNFISRPIDVSKYGVIFAGASKNVGPAGLTIVIVRKDLLNRASPKTPAMMHWKTLAEHSSLFNTAPTFSIYMAGLQLKWTKRLGGLEIVEKLNMKKSNLIYSVIDNSLGFYSCPVTDVASRSRMNVVFRIMGGEVELEDQFVAEAKIDNMIGLGGHSLVGGLRASLYNAVSMEACIMLARFMTNFQNKYR